MPLKLLSKQALLQYQMKYDRVNKIAFFIGVCLPLMLGKWIAIIEFEAILKSWNV